MPERGQHESNLRGLAAAPSSEKYPSKSGNAAKGNESRWRVLLANERLTRNRLAAWSAVAAKTKSSAENERLMELR